jgi:hypothetical protein
MTIGPTIPSEDFLKSSQIFYFAVNVFRIFCRSHSITDEQRAMEFFTNYLIFSFNLL